MGNSRKTDASEVRQDHLNAASQHYYIIGGGIGGLNTALLLMEEGVPGLNITILEANKECGGLFYREETKDEESKESESFFAHTVRTFDEPSYHYTQRAWRQAGIWNTNHLISRNLAHPRETIPADMRRAFLAIAMKSDEELENMSIADLLPQDIIKQPVFRYFFHLTGLFEHHSALALKRYMTHTHGNIPNNWVLRSAACDYESIVEPIVSHLLENGVRIENEKLVTALQVCDNHVVAIDDHKLEHNDKVIVTVGANVGEVLFPEGVLIHDDSEDLVPPSTLFENARKQPHSSVWLLADPDLASQIEGLFPGSKERDFIHTDVDHPWQITLISLGEKYYRNQPEGHRLFYIAMNDLSKKGVFVDRPGIECTNEDLTQEVLQRLKISDLVKDAPERYTATVDSRARQFDGMDSAPIVRFMPGEAKKVLVFPDTHCDNLAVIGERVRAYDSPVPTTEWVTETGHRAIQYLMHGERYRREYCRQERNHSHQFVWNWAKYKLPFFGPNFESSVEILNYPKHLQDHVFPVLHREKERLENKYGADHARVVILGTLISDIKKEQDEGDDNLKYRLSTLIQKTLMTNPALDKYQSWGKKLGLFLLNALMVIPLGIPVLIKYKLTGSSFFSMKGKTSEAVEDAERLVQKMSVPG